DNCPPPTAGHCEGMTTREYGGVHDGLCMRAPPLPAGRGRRDTPEPGRGDASRGEGAGGGGERQTPQSGGGERKGGGGAGGEGATATGGPGAPTPRHFKRAGARSGF